MATQDVNNSFDQLLENIRVAEKPWFLLTLDLYNALKANMEFVLRQAQNNTQIQKALNLIDRSIVYLQEATKVKQIFTIEEGKHLVEKIDEYLLALARNFDEDIIDNSVRPRLAHSLENLKKVTLEHVEWLSELKNSRLTALKTLFLIVSDSSTLLAQEAFQQISSHIEVVRTAPFKIKDEAAALLQSSIPRHLSPLCSSYLNLATSYLSEAATNVQPYVHSAVSTSHPYFSRALASTSPLITPVLRPCLEKANQARDLLLQSKMGPYAEKALSKGSEVLEITKAYCLPPSLRPQSSQDEVDCPSSSSNSEDTTSFVPLFSQLEDDE